MGEAACLASARPQVRVARLSNILGADPSSDNFLSAVIREAVQEGRVRLRTSLVSAKDYIAIDDVVAAMARIAIAGDERVYNVAAGRNTTHAEVVEAVRAATGCTVEVAPEAPTSSFPIIAVERLSALGLKAGRGVADVAPALVASMRRHLSPPS
jgi:nucleoside-diphosphate-sugar epimerase